MVTKRGSKKKSERPVDDQNTTKPSKDESSDQEEHLDPIQAAQEVVPMDIDEEYEEVRATPAQVAGTREIKVKPSDSLYKKLCDQAGEEGLSVEEYCAELLAEGVVVRAWEIVERKLTMRGQGQGGNNQQQHRQHQNRHGQGQGQGNNRRDHKGQGHNNRRGMSQSRYQNIMDDKASFLEYVRSQERKNNR